MSNTRLHTVLPGVSAALSALLRLARALVGLALLVGAMLLALVVAAGLMLRAALLGRPSSDDTRGHGAMRRGARRASASPMRSRPMDVIDVEAREVLAPKMHGH